MSSSQTVQIRYSNPGSVQLKECGVSHSSGFTPMSSSDIGVFLLITKLSQAEMKEKTNAFRSYIATGDVLIEKE